MSRLAVTTNSEIEHLFRDQSQRLWRAVFAYCGSRETADDAVAGAFAEALRQVDRIRSLEPWVWRVAFRLAARELRARQHETDTVPDHSYGLDDSSRDLVVALSRLSVKQRASVLLHDYAGYSVAEAAKIIGSSPGAVRVHLFRGRKRLRAGLSEEEADK